MCLQACVTLYFLLCRLCLCKVCCVKALLPRGSKTDMHMDKVKVKVKAVCGSYSTAALRHIVLLPE